MLNSETNANLIPEEVVLNKIYFIRNHKVMLDKDLAELYGVETRVLNQAIKRNLERENNLYYNILGLKDN